MVKLNCDMGEGFGAWSMGADSEIMPFIDMSNIACGFHAGDPQVMDKTVALAVEHSVAIGAHPGYPDLTGFGRKAMHFSENELINIMLYQLGALQGICARHNTQLQYIKPHGALYNTMMCDMTVYRAIVKAAALFDADIDLMIMARPDNQAYIEFAQSAGVTLLFEAFCDRTYTDNGGLQTRTEAGAVHANLDLIAEQAEQLIKHQYVKTVSGKQLSIKADTLCIHGDSPLALASAKHIRELLSI